MTSKHVDGWWFSAGHTLPHGDGREIAVGVTHTVDGEIVPCRNGLHMSIRPLDALRYATGNLIWRVRGSGEIVHERDKLACSTRTYLAGGIDASDTLRAFARRCALDIIHLWDAPTMVVKYLKTGDENLRAAARAAAAGAAARAAAAGAAVRASAGAASGAAARAAARDATAWDAARAVARNAAWAAAMDAAWDAARNAAMDAAWDAAEAAAWAAARNAAWAAEDAAKDAAKDAAATVAATAAEAAQNRRLMSMLNKLIKDAS